MKLPCGTMNWLAEGVTCARLPCPNTISLSPEKMESVPSEFSVGVRPSSSCSTTLQGAVKVNVREAWKAARVAPLRSSSFSSEESGVMLEPAGTVKAFASRTESAGKVIVLPLKSN